MSKSTFYVPTLIVGMLAGTGMKGCIDRNKVAEYTNESQNITYLKNNLNTDQFQRLTSAVENSAITANFVWPQKSLKWQDAVNMVKNAPKDSVNQVVEKAITKLAKIY